MSDLHTCGRCGQEDRDVRLAFVNLEREARQDGREHTGPEYDHAYRCREREACAQRARGDRREETR